MHQALFVHATVVVLVIVIVIVLIATKVSTVVVGARGARFEFQGELTVQVMSPLPPLRRRARFMSFFLTLEFAWMEDWRRRH